MHTYATARTHLQAGTRTPPHAHTYKHAHVRHRTHKHTLENMHMYITAHAHLQPCVRTPTYTRTRTRMYTIITAHAHLQASKRTFSFCHPHLLLASNQPLFLDHGYFLYPSLQYRERLETYLWLYVYHPASVSPWICTFVVIACVIPVHAHEACIMHLILPVIIIRLVVCEPRSCCVDDAVCSSCPT